MIQKFYDLFMALNDEALAKADEDLTLIESAMSELLDAWTDYMMTRTEAPTAEQIDQYHQCLHIVMRF